MHAFRSEEHTSELQLPYVSSYAVFCLKKKKAITYRITSDTRTLVEVMLPKRDIPDFLRAVTQALEERNSRV